MFALFVPVVSVFMHFLGVTVIYLCMVLFIINIVSSQHFYAISHEFASRIVDGKPANDFLALVSFNSSMSSLSSCQCRPRSRHQTLGSVRHVMTGTVFQK